MAPKPKTNRKRKKEIYGEVDSTCVRDTPENYIPIRKYSVLPEFRKCFVQRALSPHCCSSKGTKGWKHQETKD